MKCRFFNIFILLLITLSSSGSGKYSVDRIDPSLLENANAVIRQDSTLWEIRGRERARMTRKLAITIIEAEGLAKADISIYHDSFRRVRNIKGSLYDARGRKIRDLKDDEFEDTHLAAGVSVYADARIIQTDLYMNRYPFTVVYEYTIDESVVYPNRTWMPVSRTKTSLERASLSYIVPEEYSFRYKTGNHPALEPEITPSGRRNLQYRWELTDMVAFAHEPYMPPRNYIFPYVQTGANEFIYGGYPGSMKSWNDFGKWINDLNRDRQNLSNAVIADIKSISDNTPDTLEKIRKIYEYMQSRTRYVSIQLGIGGFQPDDVRSVERNAYGDCKALSNFTQALLDVAGIRSHYTLIYSGRRFQEVDTDFPFQYFNHAIICVPLQNDTIWLETTSSILPMGFIGESNSDRRVLLVTENGGTLARTPPINPVENSVNQHIFLNADNSFNVSGKLTKELSGLALSNLLGVSLLGEARQRDYLNNRIRINNFQLHSFIFSEDKSPPGRIEKSMEFGINNYFRRAGQRFIFQPLLLHRPVDLPRHSGERIYDFHTNFYLSYNDTLIWALPSGFQITQLPDNFENDTPFGYYSIEFIYEKENGTLQVIRKFHGMKGKFPAYQWDDFMTFLREAQNRDRTQLMIVPE
ncbi:MAG: DUF3857 domain-containing protein [Bacteroidetes bacterium]|nr:MAG: DUF3857 domain-containing protein [Bacteroidota bacterium]